MGDDCSPVCFFGCGGFLCLISVILIVIGYRENYRARTYVQNSCLIKDVGWEKCGVRKPKDRRMQQCYKTQWFIEFQDGTGTEAIVTGFENWQSFDSYHDTPTSRFLNIYNVGHTYPCYHSTSDRSGTLLLTEPTRRTAMIVLVTAGVLLLLGVYLIGWSCKHCRRDDHSDTHQETRSHPAAVKTVIVKEENVPLSPPQSYTATPGYEPDKKSTAV